MKRRWNAGRVNAPSLRTEVDPPKPTTPPGRPGRRNHVGTFSLLAAVGGAVGCRLALTVGDLAGSSWLEIGAAGFEAALVGGLADWFAVTALFRHPLGLPIPHTAIIPARRAKIIESIVAMVEKEWLSPEVIGARLARIAPSELVTDWLRDPMHAERLGAPVRDLFRGLARLLTQPEVAEFADRTIRRQLRELPIDASAGRWLARVASSESAGTAFDSVALSLANLARRATTAENLYAWLDRSAQHLRREGKRLVPLVLRRKIVQRTIVEAACDYVASELRGAVAEPQHPLRQYVFGVVQRYAERLAGGEPRTVEQAQQLHAAVIESLEASPLVLDLFAHLRHQLEHDLGQSDGYLSGLIDRELRSGILELLQEPERRAAFDNWVRSTANDLLRRHHNQIGLTVRENLEALETSTLVAQIEERVGADLQFIRLNGAVVGGLIGVLLAVVHRFLG
jgi:uncharacterized membrane-anchored protein YjiN (DUF445 family)